MITDAEDGLCGNIYNTEELEEMVNHLLRLRTMIKPEYLPKDVTHEEILEIARDCDRFATLGPASYRFQDENLADLYDDFLSDLENAYENQINRTLEAK